MHGYLPCAKPHASVRVTRQGKKTWSLLQRADSLVREKRGCRREDATDIDLCRINRSLPGRGEMK